jgi:hypothetical protein
MVPQLKPAPIRFRMGRFLLVVVLASILFSLLLALLSKWTGIQQLGMWCLGPWIVLQNTILNSLARAGLVPWLVHEELPPLSGKLNPGPVSNFKPSTDRVTLPENRGANSPGGPACLRAAGDVDEPIPSPDGKRS